MLRADVGTLEEKRWEELEWEQPVDEAFGLTDKCLFVFGITLAVKVTLVGVTVSYDR